MSGTTDVVSDVSFVQKDGIGTSSFPTIEIHPKILVSFEKKNLKNSFIWQYLKIIIIFFY